MTVEEVALGFIRVANETMCRPIRALTQVRIFFISSRHPLVEVWQAPPVLRYYLCYQTS